MDVLEPRSAGVPASLRATDPPGLKEVIAMLDQEAFMRLARLLDNLYLCMGVKFGLMNDEGREIYTSSFKSPFCAQIMQEPGGYERCLRCDSCAVSEVRKTQQRKKYLCHAGLYEVALPVVEEGCTVATILFGQMLDDSPRAEQWERIRRQCAWHKNPEALHQAFLHLRRISPQQMTACMEIVQACVSEVRLYSMQTACRRDDSYLLENYIDTHLSLPLTSDVLCGALNVGKTKLYELCKSHFQLTPMQLVTRRRMEAAANLLTTTGDSIRVIAQTVGIADENYFTKVFRRWSGQTPSAYRREASDKRSPTA